MKTADDASGAARRRRAGESVLDALVVQVAGQSVRAASAWDGLAAVVDVGAALLGAGTAGFPETWGWGGRKEEWRGLVVVSRLWWPDQHDVGAAVCQDPSAHPLQPLTVNTFVVLALLMALARVGAEVGVAVASGHCAALHL